ncbi:MAG: TfuA-related McrA-glycine thioamidation protein [Methanobacterium sp.]|nr:TfuA-related McrA-glycine thioamidation protein [Methanobacterium sp.]
MAKGVIIFTGPSLHPDEAKKILDADYRPPVGRGDVLIALQDKPDIIGIIDGVFHQKPAVAHKEILKALDQGVKFVGGSSMGALRASELDDFGMIGVGKVYESYKNGEIESDDDVAVVFNPQTSELLSQPLISMTYNFNRAFDEGIISSEELKNLNETAKSIYYPKRTYKKVLKDSNIDLTKKNRLIEFLEQKGKDIKREDALLVLKCIESLL